MTHGIDREDIYDPRGDDDYEDEEEARQDEDGDWREEGWDERPRSFLESVTPPFLYDWVWSVRNRISSWFYARKMRRYYKLHPPSPEELPPYHPNCRCSVEIEPGESKRIVKSTQPLTGEPLEVVELTNRGTGTIHAGGHEEKP